MKALLAFLALCFSLAGVLAQDISSSIQSAYPTGITPAALTFTVAAAPVRNVDLFSSKFLVDPLNTFQSSSPAADYNEVNLVGSPTYAYSVSGATISGATTGQGVLKSKVFPLAPYLFAEAVIASAPTNADETVGFADPTLSQYMLAQYTTGNGLSIATKINGVTATVANVAYTITGYPFTLRMVVEYPEVQVWITDGNGTRLMMWTTLSQNVDLRLNSKWQTQGFSAYFSAQDHTAATPWSATFLSFRSGYSGAIGLTNYKPVTYLNGQPYIVNNKLYMWGTCNNGNGFKAGHGGIISVDLTTFSVQFVSLFFFNVSSSAPTNPAGPFDTTTSISVGQAIWDGSQWQLFMSDWGYDDQTSAAGIQVYTASTSANILAQNSVNFINSYRLVLPASATASYYDNTQYQDANGNWHAAMAQTSALSNWVSFAPSVFYGSSMSSLKFLNGPISTLGEGLNWVMIGGKWYVSGSGDAGNTHAHWFDGDLNLIGGGIFPGTVDYTTYPPLSTGYYAHYPIVAIPYGSQTKYMLSYMDNSSVTPVLAGTTPNGMRGAMVIETSQTVNGNESYK